jgi:arylsulfatase A-like enzyme
MDRRTFIRTGAAAATLTALPTSGAPSRASAKRPNILLIIADQLSFDAIAAHGTAHAATPNIDRLVGGGTTFGRSYSPCPVCCPARVSMITGLMPTEHGVAKNDVPGVAGLPTLGETLAKTGYETAYFGKTHLPGFQSASGLVGFRTLVTYGGHAAVGDNLASRATEHFIRNHASADPFFCVSSLVHPHDICYWHINRRYLVPKTIPFADLAANLPALPPNKDYDFPEPAQLAKTRITVFDDEQWRFYLYNYYRMVEMLDAEIGRILDALEESGRADNTLVVFTSDHGEGGARHSRVQKWYPYEESARVPLIARLPGVIPEGTRDATHLVSGIDLFPTFCDFAGAPPPAFSHARSLKPLLTGAATEWREKLGIETQIIGRTIRSARFKYVKYADDPIEMLFDMDADPWELKNLAGESSHSSILANHRAMLTEWQAELKPGGPTAAR